MNTIRIVASDPVSQGLFVTINIADFNPAVHQPFDQTDIDALRAAPIGALPALVDSARAELERRHADLEDQAARQREEADRLDAEAARQAEQAEILANERARLEALAKELEAAKTALTAEPAAAGKKKTVA